MAMKCSRTFIQSSSWTPLKLEPCSTPYTVNWYTAAAAVLGAANTHVCNDDTYAEYNDVKNNSNSNWATCSDWGARWYAPECT